MGLKTERKVDIGRGAVSAQIHISLQAQADQRGTLTA